MGAGLSEKIVIWWGERLHVHSAFTSVGVARSATLGRSSVFRPGERFPKRLMGDVSRARHGRRP